jgi:hypothetical protein
MRTVGADTSQPVSWRAAMSRCAARRNDAAGRHRRDGHDVTKSHNGHASQCRTLTRTIEAGRWLGHSGDLIATVALSNQSVTVRSWSFRRP